MEIYKIIWYVSGSLSTLLLVLPRDKSLGLQFRGLAQEDYQIDFFQESSVTFVRNRPLFQMEIHKIIWYCKLSSEG